MLFPFLQVLFSDDSKKMDAILKAGKPELELSSSSIIDNVNDTIITYNSVFTNNKNINKDIIFLNKHSFDIFYSKKYKL